MFCEVSRLVRFADFELTQMGSEAEPVQINDGKIELMAMRERANKLKDRMLEGLDGQLSESIEEFLKDFELGHNSYILTDNDSLGGVRLKSRRMSRKDRGDGSLPKKTFFSRNSLLTELMDIEHIRTIQHIFIALLVIMFFNAITQDLRETGTVNLDFELIWWNFGDFWVVVLMEAGLYFAAFMIYPLMSFWAHERTPKNKDSWDKLWLGIYVIYLIFLMIAPVREIFSNDLPIASTIIVATEQTRILMKIHAFVRTNIPRVLSYKPHQDSDKKDDAIFPDFSTYLYFLFIPTLIYRDEYPRTKRIDWTFVILNLVQVAACAFYLYFLLNTIAIPLFKDFGKESISWAHFLQIWVSISAISMMCLLLAFYLLLHSWMNAFAEMLCFADRMFYKDWWNCKNYSSYYRTWNVVVHDWLYEYVYRDTYALMPNPKNKLLPKLAVFLISAIVHEYIVTVTLKFFYPILFVMFGGFGVGFVFVHGKGRGWNVFMWLSLFLGTGLILSLYFAEWYARINCPVVYDDFWDLLIPRLLTCSAVI